MLPHYSKRILTFSVLIDFALLSLPHFLSKHRHLLLPLHSKEVRFAFDFGSTPNFLISFTFQILLLFEGLYASFLIDSLETNIIETNENTNYFLTQFHKPT